MASFGQLLRRHRRQCRDPQRGGPLTQERLGELLGVTLGDAGYTGAAVSEWERDRSKIDEDNRRVLVGLVSTLHRSGGLATAAEADALLHAGNYRALNAAELAQLFPEDASEPRSEQALKTSDEPVVESSSQPIGKERRKQLILLDKVRTFWVEGVLETSMPNHGAFAFHFRQVDGAVARPWDGIIGSPLLGLSVDSVASALALYQESDRSLLVLGEPGVGKTMLLLALVSALIEQAQRDHSRPIPVVLSLVTWAKKRPSLEEWMVEELTAKYMIPRKNGRQWLEDDDLALFLDGFDDVPQRHRRRCLEAINNFRATRGLSGIVICSRSEEYMATGLKLKLGMAVEIQSLSDNQIDGYLEDQWQRLASLRSAIGRDPALREMARNPLMLRMLSLAYDDMETGPAATGAIYSGKASLATRRQRLFDTYVSSMFSRRLAEPPFSQEQTTTTLSWLAKQMYRFQQDPLLLEQIQPSWLADRRWRWIYLAASGLIAGLFTAFIVWMVYQILILATPQLSSTTAQWIALNLGLSQTWSVTITLITLNVVLGLIFALMQGRYFEPVQDLPEEPGFKSGTFRRHMLLVAVVTGALTFVVANIHDRASFALAWAAAEAFIFLVITRQVFGTSYNSEIRTVESLGWSWPSAMHGILIGLAVAATFEVMEALIFGSDNYYLSMIIPAAGGMLLGGMRGRRVEAKSRPNQGIVLSLRNSFVAAGFSTLIMTGLVYLVRTEGYRTVYALRIGLLIFVVAGALFGGGNVIKHYLVRLLLWLHRDLPWDLIQFLDYAAELVFLRKVGGGYIFIHRLLQQYFASLHEGSLEPGGDLIAQEKELRQAASKSSG